LTSANTAEYREIRRSPAKSAAHNQQMRYYDDTKQTAPQRDQTILALRRRGYSYRAIGKAVGMNHSSVIAALRRIEEGRPGRDPRP
jgi:transposase-like protein